MKKIEIIIELERLRSWIAKEQAESTERWHGAESGSHHEVGLRWEWQALNSIRMKVEGLQRRITKDEE